MKIIFSRLNLLSHVLCAFFAVAFSCSIAFAHWVQWRYDQLYASLGGYLILAVALYLLLVCISSLSHVYRFKSWECNKSKMTKLWLLLGLFLLLCWSMTFFSNYPGICSTDSNGTIRQLIGELPFQNDISLLFTLFVGLFFLPGYHVGGLELGVACYSLAQMSLMALTCAWSVVWLYKRGTHRWLLILIVAFYALNPYIAHYAITMWKDIPFSMLILLLVLHLYDLVDGRPSLPKRKLLIIALLCVGILFFRKNALLAILPTAIWISVLFVGRRLKLFSLFAVVIAFSLVVQGPLFTAIGIKPSPLVEALAIPLQQVGAVVHNNEEITDEQAEVLSAIIPLERLATVYNNTSVDWIKFDSQFDRKAFAEQGGEFIKVWLQMAPDHPGSYLRAWGWQTLGYWDVGTENWIITKSTSAFFTPTQNLMYQVTGLEILATDPSNLDQRYDAIRHLPVVYPLFNIASMVWLTLAVCVILVASKRANLILALVPLLGLWLSMMLSAPTYCEFRYLFAFHLCLPVTLLIPFLNPTRYQSLER